MKEFHSNKFHVYLFQNNLEKFDFIKNKISENSKKTNFNFLKQNLKIFVRETITAKFLCIELVREKIPSFHFQTKKFRDLYSNFFPEKNFEFISNEACIFLLEKIISEELKISSNSANSISSKIFSVWKESILKNETDFKFSPEFEKIFRIFLKKKGKKLTSFESKQKKILNSSFSKEKIYEVCGEELFLYGIFELDELDFLLIKKISENLNIHFLLNQIQFDFFKDLDKEILAQDFFYPNSIYKRILPDKKISEIYEQTQLPKVIFRECQEVYREIEFVGREILRKLENKNTRLTKIKVIVPDKMNYHILVKQIFNRMNLPFATTRDISPKFSSLYQAIYSVLNAIEKDFQKDSIFSILNNPCFAPKIDEFRNYSFNQKSWNQILIQFNLDECLDSIHKKELGYRESSILTWESLWKRLVEIEILETDEIILDSEIKNSLDDFLRITKSLLYDLYSFKTSFDSLEEYAEFFKIFLNEYFITKLNLDEEEKNQDLVSANEKTKTLIYNILNEFVVFQKELNSLGIEKKFTIQEFSKLLKNELENSIFGSPNLIQSGVIVSSFVDGLDPFFDEIYALGLNESNFHSSISSLENLDEKELAIKTKDLDTKNRILFYHFFSFTEKQINLSYINLDSVKDRVLYPYFEFLNLKKNLNQNLNIIPILAYLEEEKILKFEQKTLNSIKRIFQIQNSPKILKQIPNYHFLESEIEKDLDLFEDENFSNQIKSYLNRNKNSKILNQTKLISNYAFTSFILCSKKYFFEQILNLEEENEISGKLEQISGFRLKQIYQNLFKEFLSSESFSLENFLEKEFSSFNVEKGFAPYGILNQVEKENLFESIQKNILPILEEEKGKIFPIPNSPIEEFFKQFGKEDLIVKIKFEFYKLENNKIYFYILNSSENKLTIQKNKFLLFTAFYLFLKYASIPELEKILQVENLEFGIGILDVSNSFKKNVQEFSDSLKEALDEYFSAYLSPEISPIPYPKLGVCDYCDFRSNCEGYQYGFLENRTLILAQQKLQLV